MQCSYHSPPAMTPVQCRPWAGDQADNIVGAGGNRAAAVGRRIDNTLVGSTAFAGIEIEAVEGTHTVPLEQAVGLAWGNIEDTGPVVDNLTVRTSANSLVLVRIVLAEPGTGA